MRTVSRCRPNVRAVSRMLIPSTITARRTRRYTSTLYIHRTIHGVGYNPMNDGRRYTIRSPILSNLPPARPTLSPPFTLGQPHCLRVPGNTAGASYYRRRKSARETTRQRHSFHCCRAPRWHIFAAIPECHFIFFGTAAGFPARDEAGRRSLFPCHTPLCQCMFVAQERLEDFRSSLSPHYSSDPRRSLLALNRMLKWLPLKSLWLPWLLAIFGLHRGWVFHAPCCQRDRVASATAHPQVAGGPECPTHCNVWF